MRNRLIKICRFALAFVILWPMANIVVMSPPAAHAQTVTSIIVEGNRRVERDTVLSYMQVTQGGQATPGNIDASIKALFQTGLFSDVRIFRRGSSLVVQVAENPMINRVTFEGNNELDDKKLKGETQLRERVIYTRARVQSDVQRLAALYRRSGYFGARIEPKIIRLPQNRVNLVFEINEGKVTKIERISFIGNKAFSDSELRSVISTAESAWWKFFSTTDNYDPDRLAFDKELLRRHYLKNGFADFQVVSATAELAPDGQSFFINFVVDEGPQYTVGNVAVNTGSTSLNPDQLRQVVTTASGDQYDAAAVDKSIERISIEAGKAGFAFARVQPQIVRDTPNRKLDITYNLQEGPRVYIERIEITGNTRTLDRVIRREIRLVEGDAYNRIMISRARRRLTALDFFEKIEFKEHPGSAPDKVVLEVHVVEKSTGTLNFPAGYSTDEQVVGSVNITERNLLGRGQFVRLNTSLSFKRQSLDFSFTEPYFLDRRVSAGIDLFATRVDNQNLSSFTTKQYGGALRLGLTLSENSQLFAKAGYSRRDISPRAIGITAPAIFISSGKQNVSLIGLTYIFDNLDNPLKPAKGFRFQLADEIAGPGGDIYYNRTEVKGYYFHPVYSDNIVVRLKGTAGHVFNYAGKNVLVTDRFYKGGDSLRGFEQAGIGPRQMAPNGSIDSIGAETYAIGSVEVTFPVGLPDEFGLKGAVFSDFGTAFGSTFKTVAAGSGSCKTGVNPQAGATCTVFDSHKLRASIGAGLLWDSPFGPMRIDVAYPLSKAKYDNTQLIRFGVGTRF